MKLWLLTCLFFLAWNGEGQGSPTREESSGSDVSGVNVINRVGQEALGKFDQIFYGLVDEAMHHVTDDRKGAFKEMLLRHRNDMFNNFQENLIKRENITLQDLRNVISREVQNRMELFNYVGSGLMNKINFFSSKLMSQYKDYCDHNPTNVFCFSGYDQPKSNGIEREGSEK